jgi:hypothetical protein
VAGGGPFHPFDQGVDLVKKLFVVASLVVVLASASVAGAQTASTPKQWVSTMCSSFVDWEKAVQTGDQHLNKVLATLEKSGHANLTQLRTQLVKFLGDFAVATHHARARIAAVGAPKVKNGAKIHKTVVDALATAATFLDHARKSAAKFPVHDTKAFVTKTDALSKSITTTFDRVANSLSALNKYKATELEKAANADKACKKLAG